MAVKLDRRQRLKYAIRKRVSGTAARPRLTVYRSNTNIYAQLVDDVNGLTIASATSLELEGANKWNTNVEAAAQVGRILAKKAKEAGVEAVVFDRNGYLYHGKIKALADGAREGGLNF